MAQPLLSLHGYREKRYSDPIWRMVDASSMKRHCWKAERQEVKKLASTTPKAAVQVGLKAKARK
jgi:hypothetical protein